MAPYPKGSRIVALMTGVVAADDGGDLIIEQLFGKKYAESLVVPREAIHETLPPIQKPGATIYHIDDDLEAEVVMHYPDTREYVVKVKGGTLAVWADNNRIQPAEGEDASISPTPEPFPEPPPEPARLMTQPGQTSADLDEEIPF